MPGHGCFGLAGVLCRRNETAGIHYGNEAGHFPDFIHSSGLYRKTS
jgi:hypothetical protein